MPVIVKKLSYDPFTEDKLFFWLIWFRNEIKKVNEETKTLALLEIHRFGQFNQVLIDDGTLVFFLFLRLALLMGRKEETQTPPAELLCLLAVLPALKKKAMETGLGSKFSYLSILADRDSEVFTQTGLLHKLFHAFIPATSRSSQPFF